MSKRQLLFVTYRDENLEEGVSYAIELAKAMYEDITLLLVHKEHNFIDKFETLMTAVTFASVGEHKAAREIMAGEPHSPIQQERKISRLVEKCSKEGITLKVQESPENAVPAIRSYLKSHTGIDKVVLSPVVTEAGDVTSRDLNRLVRTAARPIVTMTRQAVGTA
ncbi:MAG TPA: hypothetical protein VK654_07160 [Nitrospirota bacterium]|nr:hypothetical protein [Nitrospirota bacterium]